jgi:hypothetical protein
MGENDKKKEKNSREILLEILKNTFNESLKKLENRNEEEINNLDTSKKFFEEYNITIEIMVKDLEEIEKKNNEKEEKKEIKKEDKENNSNIEKNPFYSLLKETNISKDKKDDK